MPTLTWNRILATTDFSSFANTAVSYAHQLAEKFGAELHVLHVVKNLSEAIQEHGGFNRHVGKDEGSSEWLASLLGEAGTVRRVEAVRVAEDVPVAVTQYAKDQQIDLIVMATHGRTGLAHLWLGSVAERVIRSAPCPVLAIRPTAEEMAAGTR